MEKIVLSKPIMLGDKEIKEIELDFSKITGNDLVKAESEARAKGDASPSMFLSMKYQLMLAAKIIGVKYEDLLGLPAEDCKKVIAPVALFLLG